MIAGGADLAIVLLIQEYGKRRWETRILAPLMRISLAINILYAMGNRLGFPPVPTPEFYAISLELINYLALLLIGGSGILNRIEEGHGYLSHLPFMGRVLAFNRFLQKASSTRSFTKVKS